MMSSRNPAASISLPPLPAALGRRLVECETLPSLPAAVAKVLMVARHSEASLMDYAQAIEEDPALTLRLLSLANSVFYTRHRLETHTCRDAISRIGLDATLAAVMSFGLARHTQHDGLDLEALWQRAIIAALAARHLAERLCPTRAGTLFTTALLQDIGILAVEALEGDGYADLAEACQDHDSLVREERRRFGCDHARIGAWLAASWGIPLHLASGIAESHGRLDAVEPERLCLRLSGRIADAWLSDAPSRGLARLLRQGEHLEGIDTQTLLALLESLETRLPSMAELLEITRPPERDTHSLLAEAQQHLFHQMLALSARLDDQQDRLEHLTQRHDALEARSRRDALTGLANRAWLEEQLYERFRLCQAQGRPLSLVFIDLDHFKQLNDRHGHQLGDRVLANFAEALQDVVREGDLAGRFGGEEFLVILPEERASGADAMAARLARELAERPMAEVEGQALHVSVSIGIASLEDGNFRNARELIDAADQGMYRAKREGRGRTARYSAEG